MNMDDENCLKIGLRGGTERTPLKNNRTNVAPSKIPHNSVLYVIEYPGRFPARVEKSAMCRWIAYRGEAVALERYVTSPVHSLIEQSRRALESTDSTNGDGFGLG